MTDLESPDSHGAANDFKGYIKRSVRIETRFKKIARFKIAAGRVWRLLLIRSPDWSLATGGVGDRWHEDKSFIIF